MSFASKKSWSGVSLGRRWTYEFITEAAELASKGNGHGATCLSLFSCPNQLRPKYEKTRGKGYVSTCIDLNSRMIVIFSH